MIHDEKVLVTGVTGQIGWPLARAIAHHNEVWGCARLADEAARDRLTSAGIRPYPLDLASPDLSELPNDFTYVVHLATFQGSSTDYDYALAVNAEATGLLLTHARRAKAALVMSTGSVYRPHADPYHAYVETDPLGDAHAVHAPTYSVSKIAQEAVARYCARSLSLPVVIARMNAAYGNEGGLLSQHLDAVISGRPVRARADAHPYTPIHDDDIAQQLGALLDAASAPATIVNWGGDEVVTIQEWCAHFAALLGTDAVVETHPIPGTRPGNIADPQKRRSITGPCSVSWKDGVQRMVDARAQQPPAQANGPGSPSSSA
jgi:nucleoside-diphosphate-sugar epimerase